MNLAPNTIWVSQLDPNVKVRLDYTRVYSDSFVMVHFEHVTKKLPSDEDKPMDSPAFYKAQMPLKAFLAHYVLALKEQKWGEPPSASVNAEAVAANEPIITVTRLIRYTGQRSVVQKTLAASIQNGRKANGMTIQVVNVPEFVEVFDPIPKEKI